jgi:hypothetical protein
VIIFLTFAPKLSSSGLSPISSWPDFACFFVAVLAADLLSALPLVFASVFLDDLAEDFDADFPAGFAALEAFVGFLGVGFLDAGLAAFFGAALDAFFAAGFAAGFAAALVFFLAAVFVAVFALTLGFAAAFDFAVVLAGILAFVFFAVFDAMCFLSPQLQSHRTTQWLFFIWCLCALYK